MQRPPCDPPDDLHHHVAAALCFADQQLERGQGLRPFLLIDSYASEDTFIGLLAGLASAEERDPLEALRQLAPQLALVSNADTITVVMPSVDLPALRAEDPGADIDGIRSALASGHLKAHAIPGAPTTLYIQTHQRRGIRTSVYVADPTLSDARCVARTDGPVEALDMTFFDAQAASIHPARITHRADA